MDMGCGLAPGGGSVAASSELGGEGHDSLAGTPSVSRREFQRSFPESDMGSKAIGSQRSEIRRTTGNILGAAKGAKSGENRVTRLRMRHARCSGRPACDCVE